MFYEILLSYDIHTKVLILICTKLRRLMRSKILKTQKTYSNSRF